VAAHAALVKATAGGGYALDAEISQVLSTDGLSSVADIGGAGGSLLRGLMNANRKLKGILFDLPNAVAGAAQFPENLDLGDRLQIVGGSFFESVPSADMLMLRHVLHDWSD